MAYTTLNKMVTVFINNILYYRFGRRAVAVAGVPQLWNQ